ncbi:MAG: DUF885 domain-containing protein [Phycisphaerales bacterium]|nr:DUF885 domain-containing protein [Phycisphaerales bacterium]
MRNILGLVSLAVLGFQTGCARSPDGVFEEYWEFNLRRSPERATYLGDHRYNDKLYDYSTKARDEELAAYKSFLQEARKSRSSMRGDFLSADLFEFMLQSRIDLAAYPGHLMPIKQQNSPQIALGMLQTHHPFHTSKDCANYAKRLRGFKQQVDDVIVLMNEGIRRGVMRPKITIQQAMPQLKAMITDDPKDCTLYAPAKKLTAAAGGEKSRRLIEGAVRDAIASLKRLRDYLETTYLPNCRDTVGYSYLPDGKAWYRQLAKHHTTTALSPEEIHQLGLDELKRIHAEMLKIAREVGFQGDLRSFIEQMRTDPAQHNTSASEIMRRHREILKRSDANLPKLFGVLPKTPYDLKEIESFRAAGAPAAYYYNAPDDGSRPAYFYVNTYQPETRPIYTMEALAYHEAMPGHHLQLSIAQEKKGLPTFRRFQHITAFIEGWGLYSERLGYELGGYRDPYSRFGQLTYDTWRSARLVVDTGMHYFGWTRERAIQFMQDNTGLSEQNIVSEVDRYIAWPGQALAYKIGQLEILKLRDEAKAALGGKFDIRAFHDHLLAEGSLPLSTLRQRMTHWVMSQKE